MTDPAEKGILFGLGCLAVAGLSFVYSRSPSSARMADATAGSYTVETPPLLSPDPPRLSAPGETPAMTPMPLDLLALRPLMDAMRQVETGGCDDPSHAVGDGGDSRGWYQISRPYWRDSGVPWGYIETVTDRRRSEVCMLRYWRRYCPDALDRTDYETLARVHNGGPDGASEDCTVAYWQQVEARMESE